MVEKLFKTALEYINDYSIKAYSIKIEPGSDYFANIKLQGKLKENNKVFSVLRLKFEFDTECHWYVYDNGEVEITLIND